MKRLILVLVFSFILSSFSSFAAMPCDGYMSAGFGDPVSYPDCNIQCNGLSQVTCENENFPHRANCFREDRGVRVDKQMVLEMCYIFVIGLILDQVAPQNV